jgi:hypothetical protein
MALASALPRRLRLAAIQRWSMPRVQHSRAAWHSLPATRLVGQPAAHSHPHLVGKGELTPGIHVAEFAARRRALMDSLPANSAVIVSSANESYIGHDVAVLFRQVRPKYPHNESPS